MKRELDLKEKLKIPCCNLCEQLQLVASHGHKMDGYQVDMLVKVCPLCDREVPEDQILQLLFEGQCDWCRRIDAVMRMPAWWFKP